MYILHVLSDDLRAKRHATLPLHELNVKADALNAFLRRQETRPRCFDHYKRGVSVV